MRGVKVWVLTVGEKLPAWVNPVVAEYLKRMPREARVELIEVKAERRAGQPETLIREAEARRLLDQCPPGSRLVALDEHGRQASTRELADLMRGWMADGRDVALLIGGADGLAPSLLTRAETRLALSRLTLPHALARVLLAEQLYRAASLLNNHPYHRE